MPALKRVYLIGSLRNPHIPVLAGWLREQGITVFDDWHAVGPDADDHWRDYEKARGHRFKEALKGAAAQHVFDFDRTNIDESIAVVMVMPAGKSGHLELGYAAGRGKATAILLDKDPDRFDVMYNFASLVTDNNDELATWLKGVLA